jgi:hypothetical protein
MIDTTMTSEPNQFGFKNGFTWTPIAYSLGPGPDFRWTLRRRQRLVACQVEGGLRAELPEASIRVSNS